MASRKPKTSRDRAQAIINNKRRYDLETRQAIAAALQSNAPDLKECVIRAERGETILDISAEQTRYETAARFIIDMFSVENMPDFITDAVMNVLLKASEIKGIKMWDDAAEDFSARGLAELLAVSRMLSVEAERGSREELAMHLSAVLNHPETPVSLFNAVGDELTELSNSIDMNSPGYITRVLEAAAAP
jgi:hypothetical protein